MGKVIGQVIATEKQPTTIDEFCFWTSDQTILSPFDIVKVEHINNSETYGIIEEISHITDAASYLSSYISSDFGCLDEVPKNTARVAMNYVKAKVIHNSKGFYIPVINDKKVSLANAEEISNALGLNIIKNNKKKSICGYVEMYEKMGEKDKVSIPIYFNNNFLIGPEGAHLNISGISGLASKTSYAMFLLNALIQETVNDSVAYVLVNVKGKDLLAIDQENHELEQKDKAIYNDILGMKCEPFKNVHYYLPVSDRYKSNSYASDDDIENMKHSFYGYTFKDDKDRLELLFSDVDDPQGTMESILHYIIGSEEFEKIESWESFISKLEEKTRAGQQSTGKNEITVQSWRKFKRHLNKPIDNPLFLDIIEKSKKQVSLRKSIKDIKKNEIYVIDIARLELDLQNFVFGDVVQAVSDLLQGQFDEEIDQSSVPKKIVIFVDELNKYASSDTPKSSPILKQLLDIAERGRSLGIILFSAEQFRSAIHDRVKGNCATNAYGRTNAIEISKRDYSFIPKVYQNMLTRLEQGEYIMSHPVFRTLLKIKFPKPVFKQFK